jgi:hypothetical protein
MSTVSSLNRQNRVYTASVTTPAADGTSRALYASIGGFPNAATIKSIKVTLSQGTLTNPTISVLNNGAAHKFAPTVVFPVANVRVATTAALPTVTYNSGAGTLTASANGVLTIDGVATALNDRILVNNQASRFQNGIYRVSTAGAAGVPFVLTRTLDSDTADTEMRYGLATTVSSGTVNAGKKFYMNLAGAINLASSLIFFVEYTNLAESFVEGSAVGTAAGQSATVTFASGLNWQDSLRSGCLNLSVSMAGAIPTGGKFTIDVEYTPLQDFSIASADSTGIKKDSSWQVLFQEEGTGVCEDITKLVTQNFNPYGLGGDNNSLSAKIFDNDTDLLYIGSKDKFDKFLIHPHASMLNGGVFSSPSVEFWNGSAWELISYLYDNTSDQQATASFLSYPGAISFVVPNYWAATKLDDDPMTIYENAILAGEAYPPGMFSHPHRYYIRILLNNAIEPPARITKLLPLV